MREKDGNESFIIPFVFFEKEFLFSFNSFILFLVDRFHWVSFKVKVRWLTVTNATKDFFLVRFRGKKNEKNKRKLYTISGVLRVWWWGRRLIVYFFCWFVNLNYEIRKRCFLSLSEKKNHHRKAHMQFAIADDPILFNKSADSSFHFCFFFSFRFMYYEKKQKRVELNWWIHLNRV